MPKFTVELERRFVQQETATITVEATNATEARKLAKARMSGEDMAEEWEPSDSRYDQYSVVEVTPAGKG